MRLALALLTATLLAFSEQHEVEKRASGGGGGKKVVCYYTNWSVYRPGTAKFNPQNINPYLCTHLIYAFGGLDRENGLRPYDKYQDIEQGGYAKFTGLKTYNKELKTMLAIGGWNEGSARFSPLVADEGRRKEFVRNVIKFLRQNHFDGLDLDWEYPAYRDGGKGRDKDNYAQLVQELREEFERESSKTGRSRLLLTMAVPAGIEYIDKGYDIPKLNRYLDFMNILSYDYHSAFEPSVNHHSPLYSIEEDSEYNFDSKLTIDATVKHYLMKGADAEKLVLGIPTYGRSYTLFNGDATDLGSPADGPGEQGDATREKGYLAYYEICNNMNDGWTVVQPKDSAMGPYAYKGNQWVGYDDEAIVKKKSQYVNERRLGGIMFWSIDNDDFRGKCHSRAYPLIEAAKEALVGKGVSNKLLGSGSRGGKTSKPKHVRSSTTPTPPQASTYTTPEPPTTPDPGSDFVCKDEGFFPHPRDCKKYFWCLDSGPSDLGIVAHQFTCPSGLYFNKAADSCDFSRNVICKKKSSTSTSTSTTTTTPKTSKSTYGKITLPPKTTTYTTTTTTTTTESPFEEEEDDEDYKEEDPQTIKQLIHLIKKLGGVAELEKQLEGNSGVDSTTPAISKSLYQRVISSGSPRYQTIQRNGPSGPQNEGLQGLQGLQRERSSSSFRRDKPQYVTIKRERPSSTTEETEIVYAVEEAEGKDDIVEEEEVVRKEAPKYQTIQRNRGVTPPESEVARENSGSRERPKYQSIERFRTNTKTLQDSPSTTLKYTSILRSRPSTSSDTSATTSKYVVLQRQRTTTDHQPLDVGTTENELNDEEEVTEHLIETTTPRPRVKVSEIVPTTVSVPTSTRVVTEIVEGATQRQRVPLSKLRQFIKNRDFENSVLEPVEEKPTTPEGVRTERPLLHGFSRRRPEIVVTSTTRTTPAFLSQRRNRVRSTTPFPTELTTKGRFVPSRTRTKINEITGDEISSRFNPSIAVSSESPEEDPARSTTEPSSSTVKDRLAFRNRFNFRRTTTTDKPKEKQNDFEDEVFIRGNSRETNVIRKPIYKPRFPPRRRSTTTETPTELPSSSTEKTPAPTEKTSTTETILDGEILKRIEHVYTTSDDAFFITTDLPFITTVNDTVSPNSEGNAVITTKTHDSFLEEVNRIKGETTTANTPQKQSNNPETTPETKQETTTENITKFDETKYEKLPIVSPTEINGMTSPDGRPTLVPLNESNTTPKFASRFNQHPSADNYTTQFISRLHHGRHFINSQNNSTSHLNNVQEIVQPDGRKKIILRRRKPVTESNYVSEVKDNEQKTNRTVIKRKRPLIQENNRDHSIRSNRTTVIMRKRPLTQENDKIVPANSYAATTEFPRKLQRGKVKFGIKNQQDDETTYEDNLASSSKDTSRTRTRLNSRTTAKPYLSSDIKHKRVVIRGRKKFTENTDSLDEDIKFKRPNDFKNVQFLREEIKKENNINTTESDIKPKNKVRKVLLRKRVKDLAVEESMSPGSGHDTRSRDGSNEDLEIDFTEDIIHTSNGEQEIQSRTRRPFRKTVVRSSTTTTTEAPTTPRQRTTVHSLRQRLNRFKIERNFSKATTAAPPAREEYIPEENPITTRPTRKEFRRLIRPLAVDDSQLDASHDETKSSPRNEIRISQKPALSQKRLPEKGYLEVSEGPEEYTDLPDLANVAVVAIQSLATSAPPTTTTRTYQVPITQKLTRAPQVRRRPQTPRSTLPPPTRSSPRPFSKINYDDYEDYYAEPVDVPLSGKVRIHNDGYIECLDIGNFPHPFSCRKFISCAKMENAHLLGWEYTCPKGLSFDPIGGICNWNAGLGCKE